ncbi:toll/interleukin-1 receptor domain-containing protein [Caballeronia telluris]|uniref:TIR domain protein n=1 Tax=Caballeronia telluris TaxID=326475 RepID=A0A158FGT0_9BURK|nr:toll/interleukin-1 receptor domain-containing protein [Caballeronia telluris]SAL19058.1 TIR domain protein [Caballeronia telluris]
MATIRQYFETDFDYCLRVKVKYDFAGESFEGAVLYDASAKSAFVAFYFPGTVRTCEYFLEFLSSLNYGQTGLNLDGGIILPSAKQFPGQLQVKNVDPFSIHYRLFGDPSWRDLFSIHTNKRVFLYSEANLSQSNIEKLQAESNTIAHDLQFRSSEYASGRSQFEKPHAFISHDSRDKESIARPIALNLQRKLCPVWYDEFSLKLGENLRQSIEKGLKECKKCILILSPQFFANSGWGKKEFESIFTREILEETQLVLPIWCGVTKHQVYEYSPSLLNVKGVDWNSLGEDEVCRQIYLAVTSSP